MLRAKLALIQHEIDEFLPSVARRCGVDSGNAGGAGPATE
jgi:hypothetical protein